jgi:CelD/BcsL family acetyltransferase involved in cellulose biosynthesis
MMQLHNARFGSSSRVFATPARRRFHILAARRLAAAGRARIYRLSSDEGHAALLYALSHDRRLYYYSLGIVPDRSPSPGRTLIGQAVLSAAAEGFEEFDLLRGDHDFKWRFADHGRADLTVQALRLTPRNAVFTSPLLVRHLIRGVKRVIHTGSLV